jgi:short-subunit dehydrogenase
MPINRRVVVVTGASAGVGRAAASAFAHTGARVALLARGEAGLEGARREIVAKGGECIIVPTDVANADEVERAAVRIEAELGPIDVWVNNAMVSVFAPFKELTPEEFRRVTDVTYLGCVHGTMAALRRMLPRNRGSIIQVGSALAYRSIPLQSAYCGAKAAIRGFTDSIRCELIHDKSRVHITMVQMPALNTPQFGWTRNRMPNKAQPVPPIFQPEVAAKAIVWASTHRRRELYVGWPTVKAIVLGSKLAPRVGDLVLGRTGYASQQTREKNPGAARDDLFAPVNEDRGTHGTFDEVATARSPFLWLATHRATVALVVGGLVSATAFALRARATNA